MKARATVLAMVAVLAAGCGGEVWIHTGVDGGIAPPNINSGAGAPDAGGAAAPDAGEGDAGSGDAGSSDAGISDAGARDAGSTDAGAVDAGATDAGAVDAGGGGGADGGGGAPVDVCSLPIPPTCLGRSVVFREWGPNAVGDGTYFASQAPYRLGFNRMQGFIYLVRFRVEANTYWGRVSAYGDATAGAAWISDRPCDPAFAVQNRLVAFGNHGGGSLDFAVVRNDADAQRLLTDPAYQSYRNTPQLRGGGCYFVAFENTDYVPTTPLLDWLQTTPDTCMDINGNPGCYYLAFDMSHELRTATGGLIPSHVIPGLTQP